MNDIIVSTKEIADVLQVTDRRVRQLVELGLPRQKEGEYLLFACIKFYISLLQKQRNESSEAKERILKAKAEQEEIEIRKLRGEIIEIEQMKQETMSIIQEFKYSLFALPSKLNGRLEGKNKAEIYSILDIEIKKEVNNVAERLVEYANKCRANINSCAGVGNEDIQARGEMGRRESDLSK